MSINEKWRMTISLWMDVLDIRLTRWKFEKSHSKMKIKLFCFRFTVHNCSRIWQLTSWRCQDFFLRWIQSKLVVKIYFETLRIDWECLTKNVADYYRLPTNMNLVHLKLVFFYFSSTFSWTILWLTIHKQKTRDVSVKYCSSFVIMI